MLNIVLPPKPEKPQRRVDDSSHPYNLISLLRPKIRYRSEMKQYEERLALLEKQWPGLKACKYDLEWYSRKCFHDCLTRFSLVLSHLSHKCKKIKELQDEIESYETEQEVEPIRWGFPMRKDKPVKYYKELVYCHGEFEVFNDLYSTREDAEAEITYLNKHSWTYGFTWKHFFVISNNDNYFDSEYLNSIMQERRGHTNPYYAVACCSSRYSDIVGIKDKDKEIKNLEKRLQELRINKIMADNGFDEKGQLFKKD